jgi:DNA cross-link repair 1C protein
VIWHNGRSWNSTVTWLSINFLICEFHRIYLGKDLTHCRFADADDALLNDIKIMLQAGSRSTTRAVSLDDMGLDRQEDDLSLSQLAKIILRSLTSKRNAELTNNNLQEQGLPRVITFPYSRHSSYPELCDLIRVFRPKDVYACTVDAGTWHEGLFCLKSIQIEC